MRMRRSKVNLLLVLSVLAYLYLSGKAFGGGGEKDRAKKAQQKAVASMINRAKRQRRAEDDGASPVLQREDLPPAVSPEKDAADPDDDAGEEAVLVAPPAPPRPLESVHQEKSSDAGPDEPLGPGRVKGRRTGPWLIQGGTFRRDASFWTETPQIYPDHSRPLTGRDRDRMFDQLTFVPEGYDDEATPVKTVALPNGIHAWGGINRQQDLQKYLKEDGCAVTRCAVTRDEISADLVMIRQDTMRSKLVRHHEKQLFLYWQMECPQHSSGPPADFDFDWTSVPRGDATIPAVYGRWIYYDDKVKYKEQGGKNFAEGKTKMAAWFVSHCSTHSKREKYVDELKKYIGVDVFGACGDHKCSRSKAGECNEMLKRDYKFYLAFENSLCQDYITEKFFNNALGNEVVPVIMGVTKEEAENWVPDGSFIHVDDFDGPKQLAEHLRKVAGDDDLYNQYFRWRGTGEILNGHFYCRVCTMLHMPDSPEKYKRKEGTAEWYKAKGVCREPKPF